MKEFDKAKKCIYRLGEHNDNLPEEIYEDHLKHCKETGAVVITFAPDENNKRNRFAKRKLEECTEFILTLGDYRKAVAFILDEERIGVFSSETDISEFENLVPYGKEQLEQEIKNRYMYIGLKDVSEEFEIIEGQFYLYEKLKKGTEEEFIKSQSKNQRPFRYVVEKIK